MSGSGSDAIKIAGPWRERCPDSARDRLRRIARPADDRAVTLAASTSQSVSPPSFRNTPRAFWTSRRPSSRLASIDNQQRADVRLVLSRAAFRRQVVSEETLTLLVVLQGLRMTARA